MKISEPSRVKGCIILINFFYLEVAGRGMSLLCFAPQWQKATKSRPLHHLKHSVNWWRCFLLQSVLVKQVQIGKRLKKHLGKMLLVEIWFIAPSMDLGYCSAPLHLIWCIIRCYLYKRSSMSREAVLSRLIWVFPTYINAFPSTSPATWDVNYFKYCHFIQCWSSFVVALW